MHSHSRHCIPLRSAAPPLALLLVATAGYTAAVPSRPPQNVRVVGTDYAFELPRGIRAGETLFAFENHGTVRHEMSIALLKDGVVLDSVLQGLVTGARRRDFVDGQAALIVAAPGEPPGPQLWLDLQRGRTYLVVCTLRDAPDRPPHTMLGMVSSFRAE